MIARIVIATLLVAGSMHGACLRNARQRVAEFDFTGGNRVDAILALGKQAKVCFGLRNLPRVAFLEQVAFHFRDESPLAITQQIFRDQPVTVLDTRFGLIDVSRPPKEASLFDQPIPVFDVGRTTLQVLSQGIKNRLKLELNPAVQGLVGSFYSGDQTDLIGPFAEHGKTVAQLLDLIVSASNGSTWLALVPDFAAKRGDTDNLWVVIEYSRPMSDYKSLIQSTGSSYPEKQNPE